MSVVSKIIFAVSADMAAVQSSLAIEMKLVEDGSSEYVIAVPDDDAAAAMVPAFPPLFQNGADGWRALKQDLSIQPLCGDGPL